MFLRANTFALLGGFLYRMLSSRLENAERVSWQDEITVDVRSKQLDFEFIGHSRLQDELDPHL